MTDKLLCVDCPQNEDCSTYNIIENTLDQTKVHHKLSLKLDFIFTTHNPKEFKGDFQEATIDIAENTAAFAQFIEDAITDCECLVQPLGADMKLELITNKQAFDELSEYIKVTHEQTGND